MNKYLIYLIKDPRNNNPIYVGQSCQGFKRPLDHFKPFSLKKKHPLYSWIRKMFKIGHDRNMMLEILQDFPQSEFVREVLDQSEMDWIAYFRACGFKLKNLTDGGPGNRGKPLTQKQKDAISKRHKGKFVPQSWRDMMSEKFKGRILPVHQSEEFKQKVREAAIRTHTGVELKYETRLKLREAHKGKTRGGKRKPARFPHRFNKTGREIVFLNTGEVFPSANEAARVLNLTGSTIIAICRGRQKSTMNNLKFAYLKEEKE